MVTDTACCYDGLLGLKFSGHYRHIDNPQIVTYTGDRMKFQEGFWRLAGHVL
jgi:hypothetical protein